LLKKCQLAFGGRVGAQNKNPFTSELVATRNPHGFFQLHGGVGIPEQRDQ
jgi:hypothetical protein